MKVLSILILFLKYDLNDLKALYLIVERVLNCLWIFYAVWKHRCKRELSKL